MKLMIDAEHSYFQPAIDHLTLRLMKQYNVGGRAVIYNTYQAYLVNTHKRLCDDMERAQREGYRFACKLVGSNSWAVGKAVTDFLPSANRCSPCPDPCPTARRLCAT